jgi:predicted NUDIX family NTP pyrophosphohydrolase
VREFLYSGVGVKVLKCWPPRSGNKQKFPENDRAEWFTLDEATGKINKSQTEFIGRLADLLNIKKPEPKQQQLL